MRKIFQILDNEYWYPCVVNDGYQFPLNKTSIYQTDFAQNETFNQVMPVLMSNQGRYIYADRAKLFVKDGIIEIDGEVIEYGDGYQNLRGAYLAVKDKYYDVQNIPSAMKEVQYQYCTWMALKTNQNQKGILEYARSILNHGFPAGLLIIDDSWQKGLGDWRFNERFENPKEMVDVLHQMGFKVSLWIAPYVSPGIDGFKQLLDDGLLLTNDDGSYFEANSWLGKSAVFDFCNQKTISYFTKKLDYLRSEYGIDGFKFDGGDEAFIRGANTDCLKQNEMWSTFYPCDIVECRSAYKTGGAAIIQRLADKAHIWDVREFIDKSIQEEPFLRYGLSCVIPNSLIQGLSGYYYCCPDMVGGGLSLDLGEDTIIDEELVIRNCQTEALMPYIQFSFPFWVKYPKLHKEFLRMVSLREEIKGYIDAEFDNAVNSGEPILRLMDYQFPGQGFETITDQFLIGEDVLVAPVYKKGETMRKVSIPKGKWRQLGGNKMYTYGEYTIDAGLENLPVFVKIK